MPLPSPLPDLAVANAARASAREAKAALIARFVAGEVSLEDLITQAGAGDQTAARIRIGTLLRAQPGWGKHRVAEALDVANLKPTATLKEIGSYRRACPRLIRHVDVGPGARPETPAGWPWTSTMPLKEQSWR